MDLDLDKLDRMYDIMLEELEMMDLQKKKINYEIFAEDYYNLPKKDFLLKYNLTEKQYQKIQSVLETEELDWTPENAEKKMDLFWLWTTAGMAFIFTQLERESAKTAYEENGIKYLNWRTMEDDRVCETCIEYEAQNPWPIDEFPDPPHVGCRCWPEPADEEGNTITDLTEEEFFFG
jgi:hypothetical protein